MPPEEVEKARVEAVKLWGETDEALDVHPDNVAAVRLFLAMSTQWRQDSLSTMQKAMLIRTGLDYGVLEPTARMAGLGEVTTDTFTRLRVMETGALEAFRELRERQS